MAIQSGNTAAVVADSAHRGEAPAAVIGGGVQNSNRGHGGQWWQHPHHHHHQQQVMDERDGFISWLRGEFAAANAMIDALCHHLRAVGEVGEYDGVIGCIQQRRCNWNGVLHMQQYYSVAEVMYALQQVGWRRQQSPYEGGHFKGSKEFRRGGRGQRGGDGFKDSGRDGQGGAGEAGKAGKDMNGNENVEEISGDEKKELVTSPQVDGSVKRLGTIDGGIMAGSESIEEKCISSSKGPCESENGVQVSCEKQTVTPKTFVATELYDGKLVNVVDGMKFYEGLIDDSEISKLLTLVNDLRAAGRRGQLQGQTFVVSKRPMKGHGREMIQLGVPIADASPEEDEAGGGAGTSKDRKIEPIPGLLQDVIEQFIGKEVISVKPESCIIDIFNEGDHSQPHMFPHWFGRPVSVLFLTECDMTFGKVIGIDHPGEYRGSFRFSLLPGSMLVMQGRSADFAKHAIPSQRKQRILITMTKSQPKRTTAGDVQRFPSSVGHPSSHWAPPGRSPSHIRHPAGHKHYGPLPTTGVLQAATARPQLHANGIPPIFVPAPVAPPMPFPAPLALAPASGWPAAPPRHPPPSLAVPGTGVFLPPGSGTLNPPSILAPAVEDTSTVIASLSEKETGLGSSSGQSPSPKGKDGKAQLEVCNGITEEKDGKVQPEACNGTTEGKSVEEDEQHQRGDPQVAGKLAGTA